MAWFLFNLPHLSVIRYKTPWMADRPITKPLTTKYSMGKGGHVPSTIRNHDPRIWVIQDCGRLNSGHCDRTERAVTN